MRENAQRRLEKLPIAQHQPFVLYRDRVVRDREEQPLAGVTSRVEAGSEIEKRVTATRLVAIGLFAFLAKKRSGGEVYLTVEGPEFFWTAEVDRKKRGDAVTFAAKVNDAARSL